MLLAAIPLPPILVAPASAMLPPSVEPESMRIAPKPSLLPLPAAVMPPENMIELPDIYSVVPEPILSEEDRVPLMVLVFHLSAVVPADVSEMSPAKPVTFVIKVFVAVVSLKLRLSVPAPVNVLLMMTLEPLALVLFICSVAPLATEAELVPIPFCVVFTLATSAPALTVVVPLYVFAPVSVSVPVLPFSVSPPVPEMMPDNVLALPAERLIVFSPPLARLPAPVMVPPVPAVSVSAPAFRLMFWLRTML